MSDPTQNKPDAGERDRAQRAVALRIEGRAYAAIAEELGWRDESGARHAVDRLLSRIEHESITELRTVEGRRLDKLQEAVWTAALRGETDSVKTALQIMARRAKLYGLDAPERINVGISETEFASQAAELLAVMGEAPLRELARMPAVAAHALPVVDAELIPAAPATATATDDDDDEPWSNLGPDHAVLAPRRFVADTDTADPDDLDDDVQETPAAAPGTNYPPRLRKSASAHQRPASSPSASPTATSSMALRPTASTTTTTVSTRSSRTFGCRPAPGASRRPRYSAATGLPRRGPEELARPYTVDGYRLGSWVDTQRNSRANGTLDADRQHRLEQLLGWTWDPHGDRWQQGFAQLLRYVESHGHAQVPQSYTANDYRLGAWVHQQRFKHTAGTLDDDANADSKTCPAGHGKHRHPPSGPGYRTFV